MLPLAGDQPPTNAADLAQSLQRGLAQQGVTAEVRAEGGWPSLSLLAIQLARIDRPKPLTKTATGEQVSIARFDVTGTPVDIEGMPATVHAHFSQLNCGLGRGTAGDGPWQLIVQSAGSGRLELEAAKTDIEQGVHRIVSELASRQGATVKSTTLNLTSISPRSVKFEASCTAKVFIATATLTVVGQLEIDDQLNARLIGLSVSGDGMVASMAQGMIQPRLTELNGKVIPLGEYVAAGLTVQDLKISTGEMVRLEANFAAAT
ncbi:MAG TPA: hypothetical protein VFG14_07355 [Chthoniobacteraceae bacterium]|nr:hypothetical protein [Chthoniobacteraceae bacterium]